LERSTSSLRRVTTATTAVTERIDKAHLGWLKQFSVAMHRRSAYPAGHPSRLSAQATALAALETALEQFPEIAIAVSRLQLAIGGGFTDEGNPALRELAERMHRRGVGTITVRAGISADEFEQLLERISRSAAETEEEYDASSLANAHVAIEMLSYDALALADEEDDDGTGTDATGDRLWRDLAEVALNGWDGEDGAGKAGGSSGTSSETGRVAAAITARATDPKTATETLKSLLRVARHARRRGRAGGGAVAQRVREVLQGMAPGTLETLLAAETDPVKQRLLFLQGVDALPVSAVLDWIEAAAKSSNTSISHHLLRLLKKLSSQARRRRDAGPDEGGEALREAARQLIEGWTHDTPETDAHTGLLEQIAAYDGPERALNGGDAAGAERIIQMALETDAMGADVTTAADFMIGERRLGLLLNFIERIPGSTVTGPGLRAWLRTHAMIVRILLDEPVEQDGAHALLMMCDAGDALPLLDALALSESQTTRHLILQRLRDLGDAIRDPIISRLAGADWYVLRNLLSLLSTMADLPSTLAVDVFLKHQEGQVRVEALRLLGRFPEKRDVTITEALSDTDARVLRAALEMAARGLPKRAVPRVLEIAQEAERNSDLRLKAIPLLTQSPTPAARDWLLSLVTRKRGLFRRLALQPKTLDVVAGVRALATGWRSDAAVAAALALAAKSRDPLLTEAAKGTAGAAV
jgi:hypothetical protein